MAKIDISGWKEFEIGKLFTSKTGTYDFQLFDVTDALNDGIPVITSGSENQGVMGFSDIEAICISGNTITVDMFGKTYARNFVYTMVTHARVFALLFNDDVTFDTCLFMSAILNRTFNGFDYSNMCSWNKIKKMTIKLPVTSSGDPNWAYMDSFMAEVMKESEACLENLRLADEKKTAVDISKWKEFRIGSLFDIVKGTRLTKANMRPGDIRFIGSSAMNNGWTTSIENNEHLHPANTLTVCYNGSVGETFYQDKRFWASDDVNVLYPKFCMSKNIGMFIAPLIRSVGQHYAFVDKWRMEVMKHDEIKLPADDKGEPDWAYMDSYMRDVIQNAESNIKIMSKSLA